MTNTTSSNTPNTSSFELGSLRNQFLIAMPGMEDPNFIHSVTYICEHSDDGAMGLVINLPMDITLAEIYQQLGLSCDDTSAQSTALAGGPVGAERGFVLHPNLEQQRWQSTTSISPQIALTASKDILESMSRGEGPEHYIVALGYAGWEQGQLEQEIAENAWLTVPADDQILFHTPAEQRWSAAARDLGIDLNLISNSVGHA
ncbi:YqgE/AlgH family protein [Gilvimarinus agarilyticus]|uniref:YqgE/AlgH family protein n=1 Tax=unclassified Gilvimarinus TaxID=2642066 RepID=UPI001C0992E9|nr:MULTISPECIES: YqgE/AlgH family protein [unclassified Gilvimarinus]MBU2884436.1 YqgE/AlgH family protein [Gilvimarinus agarilyticus]MDO6569572.1 YqgE/AlgH family protein [Gilvimarinus sp. 2_MG-2023]MDO6748103.1 YqgE/AlgH family protein [Gilvimarinus sp. 1_MG-2023]